MSGLVGQDYTALARCADFIKPMLYRRTDAPAGMRYEHALLKRFAPHAQGYPDVAMDDAFLRSQLAGLSDLPCEVYAGIEVNRREDIAPTDAEYVRESVNILKDSGVTGAALSWDIMLAPDEHINAVSESI